MEETKEETQPKKQQNPYLVPGSIIVAGLFMAAAIYFSGGSSDPSAQILPNQPEAPEGPKTGEPSDIDIAPVTEDDWIKGDLSAPVKVVEYSDLECPFCQRLHPTLQQIVDDYDGQVAWVYRHAPLKELHSKAQREAEAAECAGELGGNAAFWAFVDRLFEISPTNNGLEDSQLPEIAAYAGVGGVAFDECLESERHKQAVENDLEGAYTAGLQGTPYSVVIAPDGTTYPVGGALPYETFKRVVDLVLESN